MLSIINKNFSPKQFQVLSEIANKKNFNEEAYIRANPDVQKAVSKGDFVSGFDHFLKFGINEERKQQFSINHKIKKDKLKIIQKYLISETSHKKTNLMFDFLTPQLKLQFNIKDTNLISSNGYDQDAINLILKYKEGLILDFGAGNRDLYFSNVVNFEIVDYQSTDVRGVGEKLPFKDEVFDAVISIAVLEHVRYPWVCAKEILRVLKPGGDLIICAPFLQPLHGYPNHYYNMTEAGLLNLFDSKVKVLKHDVPASTAPIWSLNWIIGSWANGLNGAAKDKFLNMKIKDFLLPPQNYLDQDFVKSLSIDKNFELASATVLHATKI